MLFVYLAIIIFSIPGVMVLWSAIDVKSGKRERVQWKVPVILFLLFTVTGVSIQFYLDQKYNFPFLQTSVETIIAMSIIVLISGIIIFINFIITKTAGKRLPKSVHDPKTVNFLAAAFAIYFFITFFITVPTGKKIAFATSINQATEATNVTTEAFPIVLVTSEKECLRKNRARCHDTPFNNQYFIKNNMDKTQEVQVKIRALNSNNEEMKVIDSNIMTLKPGEMRLVETEETNEDASIWNQYSFQTDGRVTNYQHMLRHRDPE
ncbi:hypothetical protein AB1K89_08730 [Sporosarcina sp. 179-K 8C2 HS]|uniref:hypothetical protein n=1 Tax=Sporosarcina sp. 179-K 8C2 HS TaxID=3142387 RepID=UPI0039A0E0FF